MADPKNRIDEPSDDIGDEETRIPDPEQVERDREKAEEFYNDKDRKEPAA